MSLPAGCIPSEVIRSANRDLNSVCRIKWDNESGTGFLVTFSKTVSVARMILTCAHVIPSKERAEKSQAWFNTPAGRVKLRLNPYKEKDGYFYSSPSTKAKKKTTAGEKEVDHFDADHLDFALVAIHEEDLHKIQSIAAFCLHGDGVVPPPHDGPAYIIQYPGKHIERNPQTLAILKISLLKGDQQVAYAQKTVKSPNTDYFHHSVVTSGGASGAPILNNDGKPYGLHHGQCFDHPRPKIAAAPANWRAPA